MRGKVETVFEGALPELALQDGTRRVVPRELLLQLAPVPAPLEFVETLTKHLDHGAAPVLESPTVVWAGEEREGCRGGVTISAGQI